MKLWNDSTPLWCFFSSQMEPNSSENHFNRIILHIKDPKILWNASYCFSFYNLSFTKIPFEFEYSIKYLLATTWVMYNFLDNFHWKITLEKKKIFERVLFGMILIMSRQILYRMLKFVWKCFVGFFIDTMPAWITSISSIHTLQFTYLLFIFVYQQYEIWLKHSGRLSKWYRRKAVDIKN